MIWQERISPVVRDLPPSGIRRFFDIVSEMENVITLGIGEPDFVTPWHIREACIEGLNQGRTSYTSNYGLIELRQAIATHAKKSWDVEYNPIDEILVTVGVSEGLDLAMRSLLASGDEAIIVEPCFVSYRGCIMLAGGKPVVVCAKAENQFRVQAEDLETAITSRTRVLLLGYPSNPTGAIMPRADMLKVAEFAAKNDLVVVSDEIYADLTYEGEHCCFASLPGMRERTVLLNGFSKSHAMTGWRLGYALGPESIITAMNKIHQYTMMCAPITAQVAAIDALINGEEAVKHMTAEYNGRRQLVLKRLQEIGLDCFEPQGAFYIFPCITSTDMSSMEFCERLLMEERVAVVPGVAFGECGEGFIRCCYAASRENLEEAFRRIGKFVRRYRR